MARYIVTGGGGFIGGAIARRLKQMGHEVVSLARGDYPDLRQLGIETQRIDLGVAKPNLKNIFTDANGVFHVAAKVDMWGKYEDFYAVNVAGTRQIIEACRAYGVSKLVFTSSPSVVADGTDLCGIDETYPYPLEHHAFYPATKAEAERMVLAANSVQKLRTISLRPHLIFGPGDNNFVPTILARARAGRLVQVGTGENLSDLTYIDDCVNAHVLAMQALESGNHAGGRAYFISQGQPVNLWRWINQVLELHGLPAIKRKIPWKLAQVLAVCLEMKTRISQSAKPPLLTRFLVDEMATSHFFNIRAAERELGYVPKCSIEEAMQLTFNSQSKRLSAKSA